MFLYSQVILLIFIFTFFATCETVSPIIKPIQKSKKVFEIKKYAQLPIVDGKPPKITGITTYGGHVYVATSLSKYIFKITKQKRVQKWFNAFDAVKSVGREMNMDSHIFSGVRSIALHPSFYRTGIFYISYLENRPKNEKSFRYLSKPRNDWRAVCDSVVVEFRYNKTTRSVNPRTYREVIRIGLPRIDHPIRQIAFQGWNLLITHGDGSHGYDAFVTNDVVGGGRNNDGLGKILRINPLKNGNLPYTIPNGNPFKFNKKMLPEIYALGFRNPHAVCYSRKWGTIAVDVGRHNVEEVNIVKAGGDYGWAKREGTFEHLRGGGTDSGIARLPKDDAKYGFIYPNVQYGHIAQVGQKGSNTAIEGGCPTENGSKFNGLYIYTNFPDGIMYYSVLSEMKAAVTTGPPNKLTQAVTFKPILTYDHDGKGSTKPKVVQSFLDIVRMDGYPKASRADLRLGPGPLGETLISSKQTGGIYVISGTIPKEK